jgi:DNA-binding response OmpR family regulator
MRIIAVAANNPETHRACGLQAGVLARSEVRCHVKDPGPDFVDNLVIEGPPDLLLIDADTPDFPAMHTIRALRRLPSFMLAPIFVLSSRDWSAEARAAGATLFLQKPVEPHALDEAIGKHVKPVVRKAPRKGLKGPCVVSKGGVKMEGRVCDVSVSGAQVSLQGKLPIGAMVRLGFALVVQRNPHVIHCNARVVREVPGGYGLAFLQLDVQSRSMLMAYLKV